MTIKVKICGLRDAEAVGAAVAGGAAYVGFVFYPKSPRFVTVEQAAALVAPLPASVLSVGLFVDASDEEIGDVLRVAPLRMVQLHGKETVERVEAVKRLTGLPVIKAVGVASSEDIETARGYEAVADLLLLDAKPPVGGLPGGNAVAFDWGVLEKVRFGKPWMLAGGLNAGNIERAVAVTGARLLDVSSGVEDGVGRKSLEKIRVFLETAERLRG